MLKASPRPPSYLHPHAPSPYRRIQYYPPPREPTTKEIVLYQSPPIRAPRPTHYPPPPHYSPPLHFPPPLLSEEARVLQHLSRPHSFDHKPLLLTDNCSPQSIFDVPYPNSNSNMKPNINIHIHPTTASALSPNPNINIHPTNASSLSPSYHPSDFYPPGTLPPYTCTHPPSASEVDFDIHNPPLAPIHQPSPPIGTLDTANAHDVLCGRGGGTNVQIGNRRFRSLVQEFQAVYLLCRRKEKPLLARTIVLIIRNRGGRFLKKQKDGLYFDIGDVKAEEKTCQAVREGLDVRMTQRWEKPNNKKAKIKKMLSTPSLKCKRRKGRPLPSAGKFATFPESPCVESATPSSHVGSVNLGWSMPWRRPVQDPSIWAMDFSPPMAK